MTRFRLGLVALLVLVLAPASPVGPADAGQAPSREQWLKDVNRAMSESGAYLKERTADGDPMLAVNFDIDNSSIASYYDGPDAGAIPRVKRFADRAVSLGVVLVFNSARLNSQQQRLRTRRQLDDAGYAVTALCLRKKGETVPHGKQRCRDKFIDRGYTLVANVGNNPTDFSGDGYERAYELPNYGGTLG